eukprot:Hpha_TRINITY_DN31097_c0_g1::TRINITY_DN31097_c0_g1_i1::g.63999::m.63999/K20862/yigB; FMN hydrolase / 5-amino-6-(5-phospho-D-ribitylamino)uracil phosphatase
MLIRLPRFGVRLPRASLGRVSKGVWGLMEKWEDVKVVCFDLDDTLWDCAASLTRAFDSMIQNIDEAGETLAEEYRTYPGMQVVMRQIAEEVPEHAHNFTYLRKEAIRRCMGVSEERAAAIFADFLKVRNQPVFLPGAIDSVRQLKQRGYRIATLSDGNAAPMEMPELEGLLEFHVSAVDAGCSKPNPKIFQLAQSKAGVKPEQILYVGDHYDKDVVGAIGAGMRSAWVRLKRDETGVAMLGHPARPAEGKDSQADVNIDAVTELLPLLP